MCRVAALVGTKSCCMITCGMSHKNTYTHHTHTHTRAHTHIHGHTHPYEHTHQHTHTPTHTHTHTPHLNVRSVLMVAMSTLRGNHEKSWLNMAVSDQNPYAMGPAENNNICPPWLTLHTSMGVLQPGNECMSVCAMGGGRGRGEGKHCEPSSAQPSGLT